MARRFLPHQTSAKNELSFASRAFRTIEINGTFYSLQRPASFEQWAADTPRDFVFSVKGPRFITHIRRLREVEIPLANFFASGVLRLENKLGPILWQFPPNFLYDPQKMETFFKLLPGTTEAASHLATKHDLRRPDRIAIDESAQSRPLRYAVEIRHKSFAVPEFLQLLREYKVAIVCADTQEWPRITDVTSDFLYCRLHGSEVLYPGGYDAKAIKHWAQWVATWARGGQPKTERILNDDPKRSKPRDVFLYFDSEVKVRAPFDAKALMKKIS